jgi:S-ribosylhomocysteine lyase LuxS involved in autoinducer biosynthesis
MCRALEGATAYVECENSAHHGVAQGTIVSNVPPFTRESCGTHRSLRLRRASEWSIVGREQKNSLQPEE